MLKGLKIKPKPTETQIKKEDIHSEISALIKTEKETNTSDYDSNLVQNLKKNLSSEDHFEVYSTKSLHKPFAPVTQTSLNCENCIESPKFENFLLLKIENSMHLSLPNPGPLIPGHCIISPNTHILASTELESDEYEDLQVLKRKLIRFYREEYGKKAVFVESVLNIDKCRHTVIECFPVADEKFDLAYSIVLREFNEVDDEWAHNKKVIFVGAAGIQSAVPKEFSYVYFDFAGEKGIAHAIENHKKFKKDFAIRMLAEVLGLDILYLRRKTSASALHLLHKEFIRKFEKNE